MRQKAMILNRDTRHMIMEGDILRFSYGDSYRVTTILGNNRGGLSFTLQSLADGRFIYLYPSSECYGAEIIKKEEE